jgi:hypothetical protein
MRLIIFPFLFAIVQCFEPFVKNGVVIRGSSAPLKDFDPLNLSTKSEKYDIQYLREAELKHGRWGMVSSLSIPLIEQFTHRPAIHEFQQLDSNLQTLIVGSIAASEFQYMLQGWKNPITDSFSLKENYQPGDLGFKLLKDYKNESSEQFMTKELNNGRLAMISALGMIVQELVTEKTLF